MRQFDQLLLPLKERFLQRYQLLFTHLNEGALLRSHGQKRSKQVSWVKHVQTRVFQCFHQLFTRLFRSWELFFTLLDLILASGKVHRELVFWRQVCWKELESIFQQLRMVMVYILVKWKCVILSLLNKLLWLHLSRPFKLIQNQFKSLQFTLQV